MRIINYTYPEDGKTIFSNCAAALGFFDGVHLGHRALIADTVKVARERGLVPTVFTFPSDCMGLKNGAARIYPTDEKLRILERLGIECVILADFRSLSGLSPDEFVERVLIRGIGCKVALAGADFRFGHRALGDAMSLKEKMRALGADCIIHKMEEYIFEGGERVEVSATLIRSYLMGANPERAAELLGEPYRIRAKVTHGRGDGRILGYPTVNTEIPTDTPLARGVYHTKVNIGGELYTGLTNIGTCPTFGERVAHAETFILDFSGNLYGCEIELSFLEYIREEKVFLSKEELLAEIKRNIEQINEKRKI